MNVRAICGNSILDVMAEPAPTDAEETLYRVFLDGKDLGSIRLPAWQPPRVCLGPSHVAVWGGPSVYFAPKDGDRLEAQQFQPDIVAVFQAPQAWCVVTELAVILADLKTMSELTRIDTDDVIMRLWWEGDVLVAEDFNKTVMRIEVDQDSRQLKLQV